MVGRNLEKGVAASRRVLIVDDNRGAARVLKLLILQMGPHEVEIAHDGPSGVETAHRFEPDLILLDIGLPGMDGLQAAGKLRTDSRFTHTKIVALTGHSRDEDRLRSQQAGINLHVVKPLSIDLLVDLLRVRVSWPSELADSSATVSMTQGRN